MIKLIVGTRKTNSYRKLIEAKSEGGASVTRRAKGWSDYDIVRSLVFDKLLEARPAGPRGGTRYFITPAGLDALAEADVAGP